MKIIFCGRGKTAALVRESADTGFYMVVSDRVRALAASRLAQGMGLNIPFPLTYTEFLQKRYYGRGIKGFLIDDAETLIQSLTPVTVYTIPLTETERDEKTS